VPSRLPKGRLPARVRVGPAKTAQAAAAVAAAAATVATTVNKSPNEKRIHRRWMLRTERYAWTFFGLIRDWLYIHVDSLDFSE
jgi:hypothetical protein